MMPLFIDISGVLKNVSKRMHMTVQGLIIF